MNYIEFRDPVHGFIKVTPLELKIIDSAPFQRLRNIKQLAMTSQVYHGAVHTRFGHSLGVMHLVTRAFESVISKNPRFLSFKKQKWYKQILRILALTHDLGHSPFSHATEKLIPGQEHVKFTLKIIKETCIGDCINEIGQEFSKKHGEEYRITPELICDIFCGDEAGENSEFVFLYSFIDSEIDCDRMDYLLRDSLYCGVNYGRFDLERLISRLTVYLDGTIPRLAIEPGGIQAFEEFVLARYFMFFQVYFHRTRRYFDLVLCDALEKILPNNSFPSEIEEYLKWDDNRVIQAIRDNADDECCKKLIERVVYTKVLETKTHDWGEDIKVFEQEKENLFNKFGEENFIFDDATIKVSHKIPQKTYRESEAAILIFDKTKNSISTISEKSFIISSLIEKIDIKRLYVNNDKRNEVIEYLKKA